MIKTTREFYKFKTFLLSKSNKAVSSIISRNKIRTIKTHALIKHVNFYLLKMSIVITIAFVYIKSNTFSEITKKLTPTR